MYAREGLIEARPGSDADSERCAPRVKTTIPSRNAAQRSLSRLTLGVSPHVTPHWYTRVYPIWYTRVYPIPRNRVASFLCTSLKTTRVSEIRRRALASAQTRNLASHFAHGRISFGLCCGHPLAHPPCPSRRFKTHLG